MVKDNTGSEKSRKCIKYYQKKDFTDNSFKKWNPTRSLTLSGGQYTVEIWQNSQKRR